MEFVEENKMKVEEIDAITIYKMVRALINYDYFSTKCFVELLIEKRRNKNELEILYRIKQLLFEYKIESVKEILRKKIEIEEEKYRNKR